MRLQAGVVLLIAVALVAPATATAFLLPKVPFSESRAVSSAGAGGTSVGRAWDVTLLDAMGSKIELVWGSLTLGSLVLSVYTCGAMADGTLSQTERLASAAAPDTAGRIQINYSASWGSCFVAVAYASTGVMPDGTAVFTNQAPTGGQAVVLILQ